MTEISRNLKFTEFVKGAIFRDAGHRCSNPTCRKHIYSWDKESDEVTCLAEACHIYPARPGGPRYNPKIEDSFITTKANGLCLCLDCHKIIDKNPITYNVDKLFGWKRLAKESNQPERNQLKPDLGPGRTMGQEVETLEKYLDDKNKSIKDIKIFLGLVDMECSWDTIEVTGQLCYALDNVAGIAMHNKRYEISWSIIQNELLYFRSLACEVTKEISLGQMLMGGKRSRPHPYKKSRNGRPVLEHFYQDPLAEKISQVVVAANELKIFCQELEKKVFSY